MIAFDGRILEHAVHSRDLPVRPGVFHLGHRVIDAMLVADSIEDVLAVVDIPLAGMYPFSPSDLDGKAHGACGLERQPTLVPVRPAGHIAFRGAVDRSDRLAAECEWMFGVGSDDLDLATKAKQPAAMSG